uniref:Uncharacterized protein n=1 Tax=Vibrio splendidus TaxID=29497 RepID=A0A0H3ZJM0_VIBSP|nr:hypothetical protein [Vibrio splendidus]
MMAGGCDALTDRNIQAIRLSQLHVSVFKCCAGWVKADGLAILLAKCRHGIALFIDAGDNKALGLLVFPLSECHARFVVLDERLLRFREKVRHLGKESGLDA